MESIGALPVIYGDESTWASLSPSEQPFFQLASSASKKIDWTKEAEWRLTADLNLTNIPLNSAFVFVKHRDEADVIAELCHWPILILS